MFFTISSFLFKSKISFSKVSFWLTCDLFSSKNFFICWISSFTDFDFSVSCFICKLVFSNSFLFSFNEIKVVNDCSNSFFLISSFVISFSVWEIVFSFSCKSFSYFNKYKTKALLHRDVYGYEFIEFQQYKSAEIVLDGDVHYINLYDFKDNVKTIYNSLILEDFKTFKCLLKNG